MSRGSPKVGPAMSGRREDRSATRCDERVRRVAAEIWAVLPVLRWIAGRERLPAPLLDDVLVLRLGGRDG